MDYLWLNGEYMPISQGRVSVEDRSLLFGEGIYEVIAAYDGVPILLEEHLDRWERSAEGLRLKSPYSRETRYEVIAELLRLCGKSRATIYGQLGRGAARRAHSFPAHETPVEFWYARELPPYKQTMYTEGVATITQPDERWPRCWIKATSLLPNVLAKQAAIEAGAFEAILYNEKNIVTEGAVANFHVVKDGAVVTHPTDGRILGGCKRSMVLRLARENGIPVHEEKYSMDFMRDADEAFLTSTTINVLPVTSIDGKPVGTGKVGGVVGRLMELTEREVARLRDVGVEAR